MLTRYFLIAAIELPAITTNSEDALGTGRLLASSPLTRAERDGSTPDVSA
jgi:hypothetical protein